jgi:hypothetical protein
MINHKKSMINHKKSMKNNDFGFSIEKGEKNLKFSIE